MASGVSDDPRGVFSLLHDRSRSQRLDNVVSSFTNGIDWVSAPQCDSMPGAAPFTKTVEGGASIGDAALSEELRLEELFFGGEDAVEEEGTIGTPDFMDFSPPESVQDKMTRLNGKIQARMGHAAPQESPAVEEFDFDLEPPVTGKRPVSVVFLDDVEKKVVKPKKAKRTNRSTPGVKSMHTMVVFEENGTKAKNVPGDPIYVNAQPPRPLGVKPNTTPTTTTLMMVDVAPPPVAAKSDEEEANNARTSAFFENLLDDVDGDDIDLLLYKEKSQPSPPPRDSYPPLDMNDVAVSSEESSGSSSSGSEYSSDSCSSSDDDEEEKNILLMRNLASSYCSIDGPHDFEDLCPIASGILEFPPSARSSNILCVIKANTKKINGVIKRKGGVEKFVAFYKTKKPFKKKPFKISFIDDINLHLGKENITNQDIYDIWKAANAHPIVFINTVFAKVLARQRKFRDCYH